MDATEFDVESLLATRDEPRAAIEERFGLTPADAHGGARYEAATGLERVGNDDSAPATFYFRGDDLVVMYVDGSGFEGATPQAVVDRLGPPPAELRSRAGKASMLYVYPDRGLAVSGSGDGIDFIEVFPPTTIEAYEEDIYSEPEAFIR